MGESNCKMVAGVALVGWVDGGAEWMVGQKEGGAKWCTGQDGALSGV